MTEIIARPRQGGKTTEIFKRMQADDRLIYVASTYAHAGSAFKMAQGLGYTFDKSRSHAAHLVLRDKAGLGLEERQKRRYVIDNAELVLSAVFGQVTTLSVTFDGGSSD